YYLDWFYEDGINIQGSDVITSVYIIKYNIPDSDGIFYKIIGTGSYVEATDSEKIKSYYGANYGIMPMLSFGTPHLYFGSSVISSDSLQYYSGKEYLINISYINLISKAVIDNKDPLYGLGVGHLKIHSYENEYPYIKDSSIELFRKNLYLDMRKYFGDRYIRHFGSTNLSTKCKGYIYMLYFYKLTDFVELDSMAFPLNMMLSDAFLPLSLDPKEKDSIFDQDYKFSLVFPMGLAQKDDDTLLVTCGEGDFYSIELEFNKNEVLDLVKHNARCLNFRKYNYYIIATYQGRVYVEDRLETIMQKIRNNELPSEYKYHKYKTKYMRMKNEINKN
ncbi:MAG: hypothetical protein Satyrvirus44_1, partial [Satyrvirus sp.]